MQSKHILIIISLISIFSTCFAQTSIMSYNIRYDNPKDGENWWELRKDEVNELLNYYRPDFIGIQEAMPNQIKYIEESLVNYNYIGHGRDGKNTASEGTPIFYNTSKYELLYEKIFWLSETPEKVSKGWDANLNRIAVYGVFISKTTKDTLNVFNTHFDHIGEFARIKSAELLLEIIELKQLSIKKLILMGDFNALPNKKPIKILKMQLNDSYGVGKYPVYGPIGTFNEFKTERILNDRIDYIFTKNIKVKSYRCIDDKRRNNLYPSDHLPILIKI